MIKQIKTELKGARVNVRNRQLARGRKTYLTIQGAGDHRSFHQITMPVIRKYYLDAYVTSGAFGGKINVTVALTKQTLEE